jgi:hypothetical protein
MKLVPLLLFVVLGAISPASAETQEEQQACMNDAFQFCGDAIPDRNRVFLCLIASKNVISATCRTVMAPYLPVDPPPPKKKPAPKTKSARNKGPLDLSPR